MKTGDTLTNNKQEIKVINVIQVPLRDVKIIGHKSGNFPVMYNTLTDLKKQGWKVK